MISPRYLTDWDEGIDMTYKVTSGQEARKRVKVACIDFDWFNLTIH